MLYLLYYVMRTRRSHSASIHGQVPVHQLMSSNKSRTNGDLTPEGSTVEIWGKAAIGNYFWKHIFEGSLVKDDTFLLERDTMVISGIRLKFTTGPYLIPHTANKNVRNLVMILNARSTNKIAFSRTWMDALFDEKQFPKLTNLGVVVLGDEECNNRWLDRYFASCIFKQLYTSVLASKISFIGHG